MSRKFVGDISATTNILSDLYIYIKIIYYENIFYNVYFYYGNKFYHVFLVVLTFNYFWSESSMKYEVELGRAATGQIISANTGLV